MNTPAHTAARSPEIDAYIAATQEPNQSRLHTLRELIRQEAPEAVERMAYGMPTWHQGQNLVHIGAQARHVGLYPGPQAIEAFAQELRDFPTSKGAIRLLHDRELPLELVRLIVRYCVVQAQNRAKPAGKGSGGRVRP
jgi:uncharacterized protein YdhG (YjbR/CyaY superfamily)